MFKQFSIYLASAGLVACLSTPATANLSNQWYVGAGHSNALLLARAEDNSVTRQDEMGTGATFFFGRDFDERSSGQFQLYSLGDTIFSDQTVATHNAADASLLYRFFDSRDGKRNAVFGASVYGRFGVGYLERETDVELNADSDAGVYFGIGAGLETYLTSIFAVRGEMMYHNTDVISGNVSLVTRFGGKRRKPPLTAPPGIEQTSTQMPDALPEGTATPAPTQYPQAKPNLQPTAPNANLPSNTDGTHGHGSQLEPEVAIMAPAEEFNDSATRPTTQNPTIQTTVAMAADSDGDGVFDDIDRCQNTNTNSLVDATGCSPLTRIAKDLLFVENSTRPLPSTEPALNELAALMQKNAITRIELAAHSDNIGDPQQRSLLTRQRLRTIGIYLVQRGVSKDRLQLRSFGDKRPISDNSSETGRRANNRIEITEQR